MDVGLELEMVTVPPAYLKHFLALGFHVKRPLACSPSNALDTSWERYQIETWLHADIGDEQGIFPGVGQREVVLIGPSWYAVWHVNKTVHIRIWRGPGVKVIPTFWVCNVPIIVPLVIGVLEIVYKIVMIGQVTR